MLGGSLRLGSAQPLFVRGHATLITGNGSTHLLSEMVSGHWDLCDCLPAACIINLTFTHGLSAPCLFHGAFQF